MAWPSRRATASGRRRWPGRLIGWTRTTRSRSGVWGLGSGVSGLGLLALAGCPCNRPHPRESAAAVLRGAILGRPVARREEASQALHDRPGVLARRDRLSERDLHLVAAREQQALDALRPEAAGRHRGARAGHADR